MGRPLRWEDNIRKGVVAAEYKRMEESSRGEGCVETNS